MAGAAVTTISLGALRPAHAVFGVADTCANCAQETTQLLSWAHQAADMSKTLDSLTSQLRQLQQTYAMLSNPMSLVSTATGLLTGDAHSPLGTDVSATLGLARGVGNLAGTAGSLAKRPPLLHRLEERVVWKRQVG